LEKENNKITISSNEKYDTKKLNLITTDLFCHPYPHWTLKEIHEQGDSTLRAISLGGRLLSNEQVKLGGLEESKDILINIDNLIILGCGTSYYAGMIGSHYFKDLCNFNIVHVFDGAEFSEQDIPKYGKTALLLLSQSGETKDLHRCIDIGKKHNLFLIGVINVVDSMIAREVDCGCYLNAGREVAVASTKSFTSQVILLSLMSIWFAQSKNMNSEKRKKYITDLRLLHFDINKTICICDDISHDILDIFEPNTSNSCFILGKGKSEAIAKEGALKIKELTYIHAEGYSTSSLKHGPFALLHNGFPVIMISPNNEYYVKNNNAYEEILSRHAKIIFITDYQECDKINSIILPENKSYADLLCVIPLQMLAYKLSIKRGINPDMPQNLAKVVTVE
jgi:glucosamine--fructose-6-phosphate aminotransferase (isomerizing)